MARPFFTTAELAVLKSLKEKNIVATERPATEISEIAVTSGIGSSDEVLRALFILEGKSLVQPQPAGDLTSHQWQITDTGVLALQMLQP